MQLSISGKPKRIESIDILRGIVMVIMALDHTRDYFHITSMTDDPLNFATTTPQLFLTRWITHFCAPTFVFLSGTSIYLQSLRKTKKELSSFLFTRGLWLIFVEIAINTLFWSFNPFYNFINLQVLWAIGISMILLGMAIRLPFNYILAIGLIIVLGHNLLDIPESAKGFKGGLIWDIMHHGGFYTIGKNHFIAVLYPVIPWTGLMMMGYCAGIFFTQQYTNEQRRKILAGIGSGLIVFFILLRFTNFYGNPFKWHVQKNSLFTLLSFIDVHKYPPSLLYMCMTIGAALLFLSVAEKFQNRFTGWMRIFGRTAFFYYIMHVLLIHLLAVVVFFARGHALKDAFNIQFDLCWPFVIPGEGFYLPMIYLIWIFVITALYPLCKWYDKYKTSHKEKWWLSYL
jgi:uncharacterized membrane protein